MVEVERARGLGDGLSQWWRQWGHHAAVLLLFTSLAVAMTYPLAFHLSDTVVNYGDPLLNTWILAWDIHALRTQPLHLFDANNFYPYGNTLAYSENLLTTAILAAPAIWLTGNPVLAHNLLSLLSFALGGFCAYLLIGRLTGSRLGGIVGGFMFAFAHYRFGQVSHVQLLVSWWTPLALYYLEGYFDERRCRDATGFAVCFVAQAWAAIYLGIFLAGAVVLYILYLLLTRKDLLRTRTVWTRFGVAVLCIAAALILLYFPYSRASEVVGTRELDGQNGAALRDYVTAHPASLPARLRALAPVQESPEHTLFPGFVGLALALWGLFKGGQDSVSKGFYLTLGLVSLILSLGPHLHLTRDQPPLLEGLPYALLYRYVPLVRAIRVPARLALLVMLSLAVLAGFGVTALASRSLAVRSICYSLAFIGLTVDYLAVPLPLVPIEVGSDVPPVYRWLGSQPPDSVIFEFPTAASPDITGDDVSIPRLSRHQYYSVYHWQRLTMGYSGFYPPIFWESLKYGRHFPSHESLAYYRGLGVDYLLIHEDELSKDELTHSRLGLKRRSSGLSKLARHRETNVYRLFPHPPTEPKVELQLPSAMQPGRPYHAYVLVHLPQDRARVSENVSPYELAFEWQWDDGESMTDKVSGQLPMVLGSGTTVLPLPLSGPLDWPATLRVRFRGLSTSAEATQVVGVREAPIAADGQALIDDFEHLGAQLGSGLELTHVHFTRGRHRTAGEPLSLVLYWRRPRSDERPLNAYVHILNQQGVKVAQLDASLSSAPDLERHLIPIPWDLPPGSYEIVVGAYDANTRDPVGRSLGLGPIDVKQPAGLISVIQKPLQIELGENIELLGYDLAPAVARPGDEISLTVYWRCRSKVRHDYKVFTHLLLEAGNVLEQQDGQPRGGRHPTSSWRPGEIIVDRYRLTIPVDAQEGLYPLALGMYRAATGDRLPVRTEEGRAIPERRILLKELKVVGPAGK